MKKNLFLWCLYDFANSIVMIVFFVNFGKWAVVDQGISDFYFNLALVVSSASFLLIGPVLGALSDKMGGHLKGLRITSAITFLGYFATALLTFTDLSPLIALGTYTLTLSFYLISFVFYTPMIYAVSTDETRGRTSGLGQASNVLGQVIGLAIFLPLLNGSLSVWGLSGKEGAFVLSSLLFILLALPALLKLPEVSIYAKEATTMKKEYRSFFKNFKMVFGIRAIGMFLIGYMLWSDALLTFANNYPIFLSRVFGFSDSSSSLMIATILILSIVGALISGKLGDKYGHKKVLIVSLSSWFVLFPLVALAPTKEFEIVVCAIAGIFFGAVWPVSRALVTNLSPKHISSTVLSYYIFAERFATAAGPLFWSLLLFSFGGGESAYRWAIIGMTALIAAGIFFTRKIDSEKA